MNQCERELEVVRALRAGALSAELKGHLRGCTRCAETERVASALLLLRVQVEMPDAGMVWRRVQTRSRELAVKRAARPIVFMRVLSFVCVAACGVWVLRGAWGWLLEYGAGFSLMTTEAASFGVGFAALSVGVAAWYLLRESKRSGGVMPSA